MISRYEWSDGCGRQCIVLAKDKRISNNATLDVAGRDQQDMKIHLVGTASGGVELCKIRSGDVEGTARTSA